MDQDTPSYGSRCYIANPKRTEHLRCAEVYYPLVINDYRSHTDSKTSTLVPMLIAVQRLLRVEHRECARDDKYKTTINQET